MPAMPHVANAQSFLQCCVNLLIKWHRLWRQQLLANLQTWMSTPDFWGKNCP